MHSRERRAGHLPSRSPTEAHLTIHVARFSDSRRDNRQEVAASFPAVAFATRSGFVAKAYLNGTRVIHRSVSRPRTVLTSVTTCRGEGHC